MAQDGKKHSTMVTPKFCQNIVFECALDDDIIIKNPVKNLQVPQTESKKRTAIEQWQICLWNMSGTVVGIHTVIRRLLSFLISKRGV